MNQKTKWKAKKFLSDDRVIPVDPKNGERFTLEELRDIVGGPVLRMHPPSKLGVVIYCNAKGPALHLPINVAASDMWQYGCKPGSDRAFEFVLGDILLCHSSQEPE